MIDDDLLDLPATVPSEVQDRLRTYRDIAKQRNMAVVGTFAELRDALHDVQIGQERLRQLERAGPTLDEAAIERERDKVARRERALADLNAQIGKLRPSAEWAMRLAEHLERYIRAHSTVIVLHEGNMPQLRDGEKVLDGLERAGRRTRTLLADRREIIAAPFPSSLAKKLAWEQLQARAEEARPDVTRLIDRCEPIKFPVDRRSIVQHGGSNDLFAIDVVGILTWLLPDAMRAAIEREIDANAEDDVAISASERIERLAQIDGDVLASEREEAHFAELAGLLPPREDLDPRAVLGLSSEMPAP